MLMSTRNVESIQKTGTYICIQGQPQKILHLTYITYITYHYILQTILLNILLKVDNKVWSMVACGSRNSFI